MLAMTEIESLKKLRSNAKGSMTKLLNYVSELRSDNIHDIEQLKTRAKRAQEIFETFMNLEEQIIRCNPDEHSDLDPFEDSYYTVLSGLNSWIRKKSISEGISHHSGNDTGNLSHSHGADVRLPKINIPIFSGEYKEWQTFFDLFSSTIHEKEYLTSAQKFQYLKSFLRGDAERFLRNTNVTEANYQEALQKLVKRYDKKRHTITSHIEAFLKQPSISNPTAANIRSLLDTSDEALRGLKCLGTKAEQRDPWLIYILLNKLDLETQALWSQQSIENKDFPELSEFFEFLENRTDALESLKAYTSKKASPNHSTKTLKSNAFATTTSSNATKLSCPLCKSNDHKLFECEKFKTMIVSKRRDIVKEEKRCFNCFNFNHSVYACKSRVRCRFCQRKHHTLLHMEEEAITSPPSQGTTTDQNPTISSNSYQVMTTSQVVLPTAMVKIRCSDGDEIDCRSLLDSSSQESFITEECAQKLGLRRTNGRMLMKGLGDAKLGHSRGKVHLSVRSIYEQYPQWEVEAYVVPKIASFIPANDFDPFECDKLQGLTLADPKFNRRGSIEVLLGTEIYYGITGGKRLHLNNRLVAEETSLGWVMAGRFVEQQEEASCFNILIDIDASLRAFWEVESVPTKPQLSDDEQRCEELFSTTTTRSPEGKFVVKLPFSEAPTDISSTFQVAVSRLRAMERRFERDNTFRDLYVDFMKEYEELGHMEEIANDQLSQQQYYLPHHGVLKTSSSTTKLRVVFDASAKSNTGKSLNNVLRVGPVIQSSLIDIVLRFRQHQYVLTGDVEKMYRQVLVDSEDAKMQNIVWRSSREQPISHYRLKTLTYGTAPASFLSTRCLKELAKLNREQYGAAATAIENDVYVDDLMTGADSKQELVELQISISKILQSAKFNMRKWSSNDEEIRQQICDKDDTTSSLTIAEHPEATKLLGLEWSPKTDKFYFSTNFESRATHTKRTMLSESSKIFDPLGWLAPTIVRVKMLFQSTWLQAIGWDEELPPPTRSQWMGLRQDLSHLQCIQIPRWIGSHKSIELHGFCDASQWAYAAAVYCRITNGDKVITQLIAAKTKVAPIKQLSIPRLELNGAFLLTKLMIVVQNALNLNIEKTTLWTDSKIVLDWLSSHPRKWPTFIANRTSEILNEFKREHWKHVSSADNPADCASRGINSTELFENELWWNGPQWLTQPVEFWPSQLVSYGTTEEVKVETFAFKVAVENYVVQEIIDRYSSFYKMSKILALMFRFSSNCRISKQQRSIGPLLPSDIEEASLMIIRFEQATTFDEDIRHLKNNLQMHKTSKIKSLNPFIDESGVLRVGGRLRNSAAPYVTRHPIILPHKSVITKAIVRDYHNRFYHAGINLTSNILRSKYWVIRAKDVVREIVHKCVQCVKQKPILKSQIMGDLPAERVTYADAFVNVGVDYAGPFKVTPMRRRGQMPVKAYICIFVCLSTKAVHIEIVCDLTSQSFLAALSRMTARRGLCRAMFSDNGSNFVGANKSLTELYKFLKLNKSNISSSLLRHEIMWHFNPPGASHMNGLWEAAVKSAKTHLKRVVGDSILSLEEFGTLMTGVESILNSRPLCANDSPSADIDDLILTPSHFTIGRALHVLPEDDLVKVKLSNNARWELVKRLKQHIWVRWHRDYLSSLQRRSKWITKNENIKLNDIVIIKDENITTSRWTIGRIVELHPGNDGIVRVVTIRTASGTYKRPIHKLCVLPVN